MTSPRDVHQAQAVQQGLEQAAFGEFEVGQVEQRRALEVRTGALHCPPRIEELDAGSRRVAAIVEQTPQAQTGAQPQLLRGAVLDRTATDVFERPIRRTGVLDRPQNPGCVKSVRRVEMAEERAVHLEGVIDLIGAAIAAAICPSEQLVSQHRRRLGQTGAYFRVASGRRGRKRGGFGFDHRIPATLRSWPLIGPIPVASCVPFARGVPSCPRSRGGGRSPEPQRAVSMTG